MVGFGSKLIIYAYLGSAPKLEARVDKRIGCLCQPQVFNIVRGKAQPDPDRLGMPIHKVSEHGLEHGQRGAGDRDEVDVWNWGNRFLMDLAENTGGQVQTWGIWLQPILSESDSESDLLATPQILLYEAMTSVHDLPTSSPCEHSLMLSVKEVRVLSLVGVAKL